MADAAIKIKLMPDSPEADLEAIKKETEEALKKLEGSQISFVEEPVAFGLISVIVTFARPELLDQDPMTDALSKIEHVSSAEIIDFRRIGF